MLFQERHKNNVYTYRCEDVFGVVDITSTQQLDADTLDSVILLLLRQNARAKTIRGKVTHEGGTVSYLFERAPLWTEDEPCEDIPTSTNEPANVYIVIKNYMTRIYSWLQRFVVAFQEAWKKTK